MLITRRSLLTGKERTFDIPVTQDQLDRWRAGAPIQGVMSHLTPDEREFLMTGMTADEWDAAFLDEEEAY